MLLSPARRVRRSTRRRLPRMRQTEVDTRYATGPPRSPYPISVLYQFRTRDSSSFLPIIASLSIYTFDLSRGTPYPLFIALQSRDRGSSIKGVWVPRFPDLLSHLILCSEQLSFALSSWRRVGGHPASSMFFAFGYLCDKRTACLPIEHNIEPVAVVWVNRVPGSAVPSDQRIRQGCLFSLLHVRRARSAPSLRIACALQIE